MRTRLAAAAALLSLAVTACWIAPAIQREPPAACAQIYSKDQCLAMVDVAAAEVSKNRDDVTAIAIVPDPPPEGMTLGGAWPIHVRIALKDGTTHDAKMCGGVSIDPACSSEPSLRANGRGAYTDVPAGSTPLPTLEPPSVKAASPITIDTLSIPIERQGEYEVVLGEGSLPNGVWTTGEFGLAEPWPDDIALRDGRVQLELRSLERDGKPFDNSYMHGWRRGVERVQALLTFDVLWFQPGATLEVRSVVVR